MSNRRDWYECTNCRNQGYTMPGESPDEWVWGGCSCEEGFDGPHDWEPLEDYQNRPTNFDKFSEDKWYIG